MVLFRDIGGKLGRIFSLGLVIARNGLWTGEIGSDFGVGA